MESLETLLHSAQEWLNQKYTRLDVAADPKYVDVTHPGGYRGVKRTALRKDLLTALYKDHASTMENVSMNLLWKHFIELYILPGETSSRAAQYRPFKIWPRVLTAEAR